MADIIRLDVNDTTGYLEGMAKRPMNLVEPDMAYSAVSPYFTPVPTLQSGGVETLGGALYIVDSGDVSITGYTHTQFNYLYISEDGDGTATATWGTTEPTWDSDKLGYYNGTSKALGILFYTGTTATFYRYPNFNNIAINRIICNNLEIWGDVIVRENLSIAGDISSTGDIVTSQNIEGNTIESNMTISANGVISTNAYFAGRSLSSANILTSNYYSTLSALLGSSLITIPARGFIALSFGGSPYTIEGIITDIKLNSTNVTVYYADVVSGGANYVSMTNSPPTGYIVLVSF